MYILILALIAPLCAAQHIQAAQPAPQYDLVFAQANQLYKDGQYEKACKLYEQIPNKGGFLNYNLGNCAYKKGNFGYALLYWRRAERNWGLFGREELLKNIELVKQKMLSQTAEDSKESSVFHALINGFQSAKETFLSVIRSVPIINLQIVVLIIWVILFASIRSLYRRGRKSIIAIIFVLLALFASMLAIKYNTEIHEYGVIISQKAELLSGPGSSYAHLGHLLEAQEAVILQESGDFYKIRILNNIGWVAKKYIERI